MAKQVLPIVGGIAGAFIGMPQLGFMVGSALAAAIPDKQSGPGLGDLPVQTSQEGNPRAIVYGTTQCTGYIIDFGPPIETYETPESAGGKGGGDKQANTIYRNYAVAICEGPIGGLLRVWENDKLVYDLRQGSLMAQESLKWMSNKNIFLGTDDQPPSVFLEVNVSGIGTTPTYAGTAYLVFGLEDLTDTRGAIPQYRFEVANSVTRSVGPILVGPMLPCRPSIMIAGGDDQDSDVLYAVTQMNGSEHPSAVFVEKDKTYSVSGYKGAFSPVPGWEITNAGDTLGDERIWPVAISNTGVAVSYDGNFGLCKITVGGQAFSYLKPYDEASTGWWYSPDPELYSSLVWITEGGIVIGLHSSGNSHTPFNRICAWPLSNNTGAPNPSGADAILPYATVLNVDSSDAPWFVMHISRQGHLRTINTDGLMLRYTTGLDFLGSEDLPDDLFDRFPGRSINGFGVDTQFDIMIVVRGSANLLVDVYQYSKRALLTTYSVDAPVSMGDVRVVFGPRHAYIQSGQRLFAVEVSLAYTGNSTTLAEIVLDMHDRCGLSLADVDASELLDEFPGFTLQGSYDAAAAIDALRSVFFFDRCEDGERIAYPKRGKAVVETLTIDDLVEVPDLSKREQASEVPRKFHLSYPNATAGYAALKADSEIRTADFSSTDEATAQTSAVMTSDMAAQTASKMHKVIAADAQGEIKLTVPTQFIRLVPSDCVGLSLRGQLRRLRIDAADMEEGRIELTLRTDRQSAYTSNLTGIPVREPTLPPSTIVGDTQLAVLDISSRLDTEDDLHYLVAGSGALPGWYAWTLQRSLDGGANYVNVEQFRFAGVMGSLVEPVAEASEFFTDTTNVVKVSLYRQGQSLESITIQQFLSEGGAFALEKEDGTWEVMQYLDAEEDSNGDFLLSTLHRGVLNSGASAHMAGAKFVMLQSAQHIPAQSAWIGQELTNRAVSFEETPEAGMVETITYAGRSQLEWPVAYLSVDRDGADVLTGSWTPRHRFGTEDAPVASINFQGYRVTLSDGVDTVSFDGLTPDFTYDASAMTSPVTVSLSSLNRITGPGPATSVNA